MDSILSTQQYIQQMIRYDASNVDVILTPPASDQVDEGVWKYEHLRQFCMQLNGLAVMLQDECDVKKCPQMIANEQWIYLCAAHKNPEEVCAHACVSAKFDEVLCHRLHAAHARQCGVVAEQQQVFCVARHHQRVVDRKDWQHLSTCVPHLLARLLPPPHCVRYVRGVCVCARTHMCEYLDGNTFVQTVHGVRHTLQSHEGS
jgi:hypothetical protein